MTVAAEVEALLAGGGEADDLLRDAVGLLHERLGRLVRISFVEGDGLVPGPTAGEGDPTTAFPISFAGRWVADLEVAGELSADEHAELERAAAALAPYALVGWDTGGEAWTP